MVEKDEVVDGSRVEAGDAVLALLSSGLHTNGYSLARAVLAERYDEPLAGTGGTVGDALLEPHRSYLEAVRPPLAKKLVRGMTHITGGGIPGNLPRVLPGGLGARIIPGSWPVPPIFDLIRHAGEVQTDEMRNVFNMGAGFLMVVAPGDVTAVRREVGEDVFVIGEIAGGGGGKFWLTASTLWAREKRTLWATILRNMRSSLPPLPSPVFERSEPAVAPGYPIISLR